MNMSLDRTVSSNLQLRLRDGAVEVWTARIDDERLNARYETLLDEDERARAGRFAFERDRIRFIQSHGVTRLILGEVLQVQASELKFSRGPWGKPRLEMTSSHVVPEFSLSHSGDYCALAIGRSAVGIDIEKIRDVPQMNEIAQRHFAPAEFQQITALAGIDRQAAFFASWTRKEAVAKALGFGLGLDAENQSAMGRTKLDPVATVQLHSPSGYAAAIAYLASSIKVNELTYSFKDALAPRE